ncbi:3-hydroxybutyrate dehydrogenase [Streptomyces sp. CC53]|uniref:3-hydroxybutyrate dehydrogenase n=1 Tax=unclassified Streptomyces TaxID=2593676 RepID=UPI0008DC6FD9|nr:MULTISPECIES: 3-hydroxybutyrate dehydrogenase [unclassified Streptomyces]OII61142.1 3-hydroxybutyrate dehydrogenase [Streptomyces sp. CC53]OII69798.1 3-hydroxybutyrate dehydrogenase [Streptomyces sp. CC77]
MTNSSPPAAALPPAAPVDLSGRTALVTGGGSGIGRACVLALAQAGAAVQVVDRDAAAAGAVAALAGAEARVADLADAEAVDRLPAEVDILVNNAGLQHVAPLTAFPPERFELIQKVMVTAPFLLMRRTLPHMYARGWGRIVNVSSVHGLRASAYKSAYVAAKHALEGLSKVAAIEGAPHGVTSNCVNPGYVRTPLVEGQVRDQAAAHGISEGDVLAGVMLARSPAKRLLEPEEVAAAVLWLCGPHAAGITGTSLPLDGGWTAN